jgi:hypothetical protein
MNNIKKHAAEFCLFKLQAQTKLTTHLLCCILLGTQGYTIYCIPIPHTALVYNSLAGIDAYHACIFTKLIPNRARCTAID